MQKIKRNEILSLKDYETSHQTFQKKNISIKQHRRIYLGPLFMFLFENRDTIIYQIQEMIRIEKIQDEKAIQYEIDTYNQLLPNTYELSATLLIEIENPEYRKIKLKELYGLEKYLFLRVENQEINAVFDDQQLDSNRISSVQFIKFPLNKKIKNKLMKNNHIELSSNHPYYTYSNLLNKNQLEVLRTDLEID